jgi:hypothetical protein
MFSNNKLLFCFRDRARMLWKRVDDHVKEGNKELVVLWKLSGLFIERKVISIILFLRKHVLLVVCFFFKKKRISHFLARRGF